MLNKLVAFIRNYRMVQLGDHVTCAVSGGADSIALLYGMLLVSEKLGITVSAAHFNHRLRGEESDRDENFVRQFCQRHDIPLQVGSGQIVPGKKGLEAAARNARYAFLQTLPGKIATAHTADDNSETVLLHLIRGTGLKGLGGISPINGNVIRPLLGATRQDVLDFLEEYHLQFVNDSSNATDLFLRNRLRHHVMPLLKKENPRLAENLSAMALRLRQDEQMLSDLAEDSRTTDIATLRKLPGNLRQRALANLLEAWGVTEPEAAHIALAEKLVFSQKPSAKASFPGGVTISRCYDRLEKSSDVPVLETAVLSCPGEVILSGLRVRCMPATELVCEKDRFVVIPSGEMVIRSRLAGDEMRRSGGRKKLKELFVDSKIPAAKRSAVPVVADDAGVLGVYGFGVNTDRMAGQLPAVEIFFESI